MSEVQSVHAGMPDDGGESGLSRPKEGRSGRRKVQAEGSCILRLCTQVLPELQALRGRMPVRRAYWRHDTVCTYKIRFAGKEEGPARS